MKTIKMYGYIVTLDENGYIHSARYVGDVVVSAEYRRMTLHPWRYDRKAHEFKPAAMQTPAAFRAAYKAGNALFAA